LDFDRDGIRKTQFYEIIQYQLKDPHKTALHKARVASVTCVDGTTNCSYIYANEYNDSLVWKGKIFYSTIIRTIITVIHCR